MSSGEIIRKAGITRDTLRYYLEIELIKPEVNQENGYKIYSDEDLNLLKFIKQAQGIGFSLAQIRKLSEQMRSSCCKHQSLLPYLKDQLIEVNEKIASLEEIKGHLQFLIHDFENVNCEIKPTELSL